MQRESFLRLVSQRLYPALRATGFRGSGTTLRRIDVPVVHVFNVQGGSAGNEFFVNLGATLTNLQMHGVTPTSACTLKEYQCVFRERVDPPAQPNRAWPYPHSDAEAEQTLNDLSTQYAAIAEPWLALHGKWPESFVDLVEAGDALEPPAAHMLVLARIALVLHRTQRAGLLGRAALERCPASASGLRFDLEQLVSAASAA
jgi:Domain of unknown function (DUF4304)